MGFKASVKQCCLCSTLFGEGKTGQHFFGRVSTNIVWGGQNCAWGRACYVESCRYCVSSDEGFVAVETSRRRLIDSSPSLLEP